MKKKILSMLLATCMLSAMIPISAFAGESVPMGNGSAEITDVSEAGPESGTCGENLTWILEGGTLTISGTGSMEDFTYNKIAPWAELAFDTVVIRSGVTTIGNEAFFSCSGLKNVKIPESVSNVGVGAFDYCSDLSNVEFQDGVKSIGKSAFKECRSLPGIDIPDSVTYIGSNAFYGCIALENVKLPNYIKTIEESTFNHCRNISSVHIPDGVERIGDSAFSGCDNLKEVEIPESVKQIMSGAFSCVSLMSVRILNDSCEIGKDEKTLGTSAVIYGNPGSTTQKYAEDYKKTFAPLDNTEEPKVIILGSGMYGENIHWELNSNGILSISGNGNIEETSDVPIPWTDEEYIDRVRQINIGDGVTHIGDNVFQHCGSLIKVEIPNTVTSIGKGSFDGCPLQDINFPDNLKSIGDHAFGGCHLKVINLPEGLETIGDEAFSYSYLTEIYIPASVVELGWNTFDSCPLTSIHVDEGNANFISEDGILYDREKTTLIQYPPKKEGEHWSIPSTVMVIGERAFWGNENLASISIPSSVKKIQQYAFSWTNKKLQELTIPASVEILEDYVCHCSPIKKITILNNTCKMPEHPFAFSHLDMSSGGTIYGYAGSTAEAYTEKYKYDGNKKYNEFVAIDAETPTQTIIPQPTNTGTPTQTIIPQPTDTGTPTQPIIPQPTNTGTPTQTETPQPTSTATPTQTETPQPTNTVTPTATVTPIPKDISRATVNVIPAQTYTGAAVKPNVTVKNGDKILQEGTDYTLAYQNNVAVGTAEVRITGKGSYKGSIVRHFDIKRDDSGSPDRPALTPAAENGTKTITAGDIKLRVKTTRSKKATILNFVSAKKNITVPSTVKVNKISYRVTSLGANAFVKAKKVTKITVPKSVNIKKNAFKKAKKLKILRFKIYKASQLKIQKGAFSGLDTRKMVVQVEKSTSMKEVKKIAKILKKAGFRGVVKRS